MHSLATVYVWLGQRRVWRCFMVVVFRRFMSLCRLKFVFSGRVFFRFYFDILLLFFFFFSSRRRHTRFDCDWSSGVLFRSADAGHLDILAGYLHSIGRAAERLTGRETKRLEPGVGSVRSGLHVPGDLAVDNRKLLNALYA